MMDKTECTLMDAAKKIEKDFLTIGLSTTLDKFLTSEEYETLRFALKGTLSDSYNGHWDVMNQIRQKVDKIATEALVSKLATLSPMLGKESLKPRYAGFETSSFDLLIENVNEFINSDECKEFIEFDFKTTDHGINERHNRIVYSGFIKYRAPDESESKKSHDAVKEFASEVRKTIEETY